MNKSELILQYIKTLIWPFIMVFGVFMFQDQVASLLEGEIEAEIFGVKVRGKSNSGLEELAAREDSLRQVIIEMQNNAAQLANVNTALASANDTLKTLLEQQNQKIQTASRASGNRAVKPVQIPRMETKALAAESEKLVSNLQAQVDQTLKYTSRSKYDTAEKLERRGFEALIEQDFKTAFEHFTKAAKAWPSYHNVAEIARLLRSKSPGLNRSATRNKAAREVFREILKKYSWGMPKEAKAGMKKFLKS